MEMRTVRPNQRPSQAPRPVRAEVIRLLFPLPEILAAIGPARKATEAIGPVTDVANAINKERT